jgi:hypothetical protein
MTTCLLYVCLAAGADLGVKAVVLSLYADEPWYRSARGEEVLFDGTLELNPGSGVIGAKRFNPYQLTFTGFDGKPATRELYLPGKAQLLIAYRGQRVRVLGKAIDTVADGKTLAEIWPARLEVVGAGGVVLRDPSGIHARCVGQLAGVQNLRPQQLVIRSAEDLARHMGLSGSSAAETASDSLAKRLRLTSIDWSKSMLVHVSAGLQGNGADRLSVTRLEKTDRGLTVYYRLAAPQPGAGGLSYPAETVLIDRFDGEVRILADKPTP